MLRLVEERHKQNVSQNPIWRRSQNRVRKKKQIQERHKKKNTICKNLKKANLALMEKTKHQQVFTREIDALKWYFVQSPLNMYSDAKISTTDGRDFSKMFERERTKACY